MWKTGHSLIKARMKELDAPLAGEMSGHMFFGGDWFGFDDALFAAARLLEIVSRRARPGWRACSPTCRRPLRRPRSGWTVPTTSKFDVVERAAAYFRARYQVNDIDGVRIVVRARVGSDPRLEHPADPGAPVRSHGRAIPRRGYQREVQSWLAEQGVRS